MFEAVRESWQRHGLKVGVPTITGAVGVDVHAHGMSLLSAAGIVVGIVCTLGSFALKVVEFVERRKSRGG